jgi:dynein heavy chain, axonemal
MRRTVAALRKLDETMNKLRDDLEVMNKEEGLFGWEVSAFPELQDMFLSKEPFDKLWTTALEFTTKSNLWMNG